MLKTKSDLTKLTEAIVAAQNGDQKAYTRLLRGAALLSEKFIGSRLRDPQTVEDVVQDILFKIHRSLHTYNSMYPFEAWLYAIARNCMNDQLKKIQKNMETSLFNDSVVEPMAESEISALELQYLKNAMDRLSEKQRKVVTFLKLEGMTIKETAQKMKMSESAVKVAAHRGYKVLFEELKL
ncbi:MAG: sigma-70 family RNA polymerase sigma factor [Bdellovibrionales bacterium]